MKSILRRILFTLAQGVLRRYHPEIIAITGSAGKTSTREAIATVLAPAFSLRQSAKNYNTEIGVPLAILGSESGGRSAFAWLGVIVKGVMLVIKKHDFPDVLVLEYALDHPGDIAYLVRLAKPHIAVLTTIGEVPVHVEAFRSREELVREKAALVTQLTKEDVAIVNADDPSVKAMARKTKAKVVTYGRTTGADIRLVSLNFKGLEQGIQMKVAHGESTVPVSLPHLIGEHQVYAVLAAIAVGVVKGVNLVAIADALARYESPPGRMRVISGIKGTTIIDDSYNSSPDAALAALETLRSVEETHGRKIAVFGDMAELGSLTEKAHHDVGERTGEVADALVTVGAKAKAMREAARDAGMAEDQIFSFDNAESAGLFLQDFIVTGDLLLVKGSQVVRMEKIVKELMAEPLRAGELLVRQDADWAQQ
ncbi:MAG: UDP-N-acetylmuramoyl-tripeptide--D-alanyl-D-alanine ligase [Candidatus Kerfeldbacteria bacterium]|nr:UDP-N-acetylmuramoyl-tripeptide--D-alanyl-D-alanine ligase [Candidatus Kerfeldbacteria bacterium]